MSDAAAAGPGGLVRLVFTAVGIGVGSGLLLLALTAPSALVGRFDRAAWLDSAVVVPDPNLIPQPVVASAGAALWLSVSDYHDGRPLTRVYLAALGDDPPVPPGLSRVPGPGEVAVSPALRRLLESTPDSELGDRFPGRAVLTIGPAGLAHPDELVGIIGRTPDQLRDVPSVVEVNGDGRSAAGPVMSASPAPMTGLPFSVRSGGVGRLSVLFCSR